MVVQIAEINELDLPDGIVDCGNPADLVDYSCKSDVYSGKDAVHNQSTSMTSLRSMSTAALPNMSTSGQNGGLGNLSTEHLARSHSAANNLFDTPNVSNLIYAVSSRDIDLVKQEITPLNVNEVDLKGDPCLLLAIGDLDIMRLLLQSYANPNSADFHGQTALHKAAQLVSKDSTSNCDRAEGMVMLSGQTKSSSSGRGGKSSRSGAQSSESGKTKTNHSSHSLKYPSLKSYSHHAIKLLLEHLAHVNSVDDHGETPLSYAVNSAGNSNSLSTVKLLLDHGASALHRNKQNQTALHSAISRGDKKLCGLLLSRAWPAVSDQCTTGGTNRGTNSDQSTNDGGSDFNNSDLKATMADCDSKALQKDSERKDTLESLRHELGTYAISVNQYTMGQELLPGDVYEDLMSKKRENSRRVQKLQDAIVDAVEEGDLNQLKTLAVGTSRLLFAPNEEGLYPLLVALENGHLDIVLYLLCVASQPGSPSATTETIVATKNSIPEQPQEIKEIVNVTEPDSGESCLMKAARLGNVNICRTLLQMGAETDATNHIGQTPISIAENYSTEVLTLFQEWLAK